MDRFNGSNLRQTLSYRIESVFSSNKAEMLYFKTFIIKVRGSAVVRPVDPPIHSGTIDPDYRRVRELTPGNERSYFVESFPGFFVDLSVEPLDFFSDDVELDFESFESDFLVWSAFADFL